MTAPNAAREDNLRGAAWLIADMSLNIWALGLVKAMGADYSAAQIVFLRASVGLVVILPWVWRDRGRLRPIADLRLHLVRVMLSAATLLASFFAIARVPFALFSAINFTRPILLMLLAALLLRETIAGRRWIAGAIGLVGAVIAAAPGQINGGWGLVALCFAVTTGTLAVILTRRLKGAPETLMMLFYTGGIAAILAPIAMLDWHPVDPGDWPFLLAIGVFAQAAQLCFIRAHWLGDAGVLGPVGYFSLILAIAVGYFGFGEVPGWPLIIGATMILSAGALIARDA